jgi:2-deoxy-D-gluconate 3-dehydrogenase
MKLFGKMLVDDTVKEFGSIDILVNNAGTIRRAPAAEHSAEFWNTVIDTNLNSVWFLSQYAGRLMLKQGHGKIINTASLLSFQGGITGARLCRGQGRVAQLTKALANEWADKGINVNAIAPGYMATDNTTASARRCGTFGGDPKQNSHGTLGAAFGSGGHGGVVCLGGRAIYVQGHVLVVDGGWLCR